MDAAAPVAVIRQGKRYVARIKNHDTHVIAKLPCESCCGGWS